jgi:hypothetical protein
MTDLNSRIFGFLAGIRLAELAEGHAAPVVQLGWDEGSVLGEGQLGWPTRSKEKS